MQAIDVDVWKALTRIVMKRYEQTSESFSRLGLTPGHIRALLILDSEEGWSMRQLAANFVVDASTVTWIVDRLIDRGLVVRRESPTDRRVKLVTLTAKGARTKAKLEEMLYAPPAEFSSLSRPTLRALMRAFEPAS